MLYVYSSMHSAKESGDLKGIGSKRVSKVPPAMECAACVKLATKVEVLENENKELKSTIIVLENRVEALENDIKELKSTNINFMEQLNSLRENVKNLMEHVVPTNEIRLRVLLYQFRDYIGKHLRKKPANQNWTVYLGNIANDPAKLLCLGVRRGCSISEHRIRDAQRIRTHSLRGTSQPGNRRGAKRIQTSLL